MNSLSDGGKEGIFHAQLAAGIREMGYVFPSQSISPMPAMDHALSKQ